MYMYVLGITGDITLTARSATATYVLNVEAKWVVIISSVADRVN